MAHLLNQVSYSRIINSEYNSEFENTDETDHHFAPKQSHQQPSGGGGMDVKNGESEWSSCPRNKPSRMTATTMQPGPAQMVWREIFNFIS